VTVEDQPHKGLQGRLTTASAPLAAPPTGSPAARSRSRSAGWPPTWPHSRCCSPAWGRARCCSFEKPTAPESSPDNAIIGHLVGILAGVAAITVFGLLHAPSVLEAGVTLARVGAAALSVALVALALPPLRASHPRPGRPPCWSARGRRPPRQLAWVLAGVLLLTAVAWLLNRLAGLPLALRQD
jgi:HPP family